eukprot:s2582_g11.t1
MTSMKHAAGLRQQAAAVGSLDSAGTLVALFVGGSFWSALLKHPAGGADSFDNFSPGALHCAQIIDFRPNLVLYLVLEIVILLVLVLVLQLVILLVLFLVLQLVILLVLFLVLQIVILLVLLLVLKIVILLVLVLVLQLVILLVLFLVLQSVILLVLFLVLQLVIFLVQFSIDSNSFGLPVLYSNLAL